MKNKNENIMAKIKSAGLLMFWEDEEELKIFLVHPGGPYWTKKDLWGIPKGLVEENESLFEAAKREFEEETSIIPEEPYYDLGETSSKVKSIHTWAFLKSFDGEITSNLFEMEWPPKSGEIQEFPENDKGRWFTLTEAKKFIFTSQIKILENFEAKFNI
jgi:predicted NUDIX family NTP pyrophosphohydrolase